MYVTLERRGKVVNMLKAGNDISFKKKRRFSQVAGHNDTTVDRVLNRQALWSPPKRFMREEASQIVELPQPGSESWPHRRDEVMEMQEERKSPDSEPVVNRHDGDDELDEFELGL